MLFRTYLGDVIRENRHNQNLTLRQLAARSCIALGYLSELERGHKEMSSEILASLADGLGIGAGDLVVQVGLRMNGSLIPDTPEALYAELVR